ncbi:hypothetical protein [Sphingomonas sp.]|uniref:hypothetical protein n=1 Tax=Sphingomonas sp. TaxID=28214 RepID=UPI002EDBAF13
MLLELRRAHDVLLSCLDELERLTLDDTLDRAKLANIRWKLSKASAERRKRVDAACDYLSMHSATSIDRDRVAALRADIAENVAASSSHVRRWSMDQVLIDWDGYRAASATLRKAMRGRILQEQRALYPLLERAAA